MKLRNHRWTIPLLILFAGTTLRVLVLGSVEDVSGSSYASMQKASLNYLWAKSDLPKELDKWHDGDFWKHRLYELEDGRVDIPELWRQLQASNHPPLYYATLHLITAASHRFPPSFTPGLILNGVASLLALLVFYRLCLEVFESRDAANFGLAVAAFSLAPIFPLTLLKGYTMQVGFVSLQVVLFLRLADSPKAKGTDYLLYALACLAGFLTHYYSYLFTAILSLLIAFHYLFVRRDVRRLAAYAGSTLAAICAALVVYPFAVRDVMADARSEQIQAKVLGVSRIEYGADLLLKNAKQIYSGSLRYFLAAVFVLVVVQWIRTRHLDWRGGLAKHSKAVYAIAFGVISFGLIQFISRYTGIRYAAPAVPMLLLMVAFLFDRLTSRRQLLMVLFAGLLLAYSSKELTRAFVHDRPSRKFVQDWFIDDPMATVDETEPVLILTDDLGGEVMRSVLFHVHPRAVAIAMDELDVPLLRQRSDAAILVRRKLARQQDVRRSLDAIGYENQGRILRFFVYRKSAD